MIKYLALAGAAAVMVTGLSSSAHARKLDFELCDGLQAPKPKGDGMRPPASDLYSALMFSTSEKGLRVKACTDALADPLLLQSQPLRRASLLRSRAFVNLSEEAPDAALADIAVARELSTPFMGDAMFARTMGVSLDIIEALALVEKGEHERARGLIVAAGRRRAYSLPVQELTTLVLQHTARDGDTASPYAALLPLDPDALGSQFAWLVSEGRFADAAAIYPRIDAEPAPPVADGKLGANLANAIAETQSLAKRSITDMLGAYSYAAIGKLAEARALVAQTQKGLDKAMTPPPEGGFAMTQNTLAPIKQFADVWAFLILARCDVADGHASEVAQSLVGKGLPTAAATVELFTAMRENLPANERGRVPEPEQVTKALAEKRAAEKLEFLGLEASLPRIEFSANQAEYKLSAKSVIDVLGPSGFRRDGFRSREDVGRAITTVEFLGNSATASSVDEMTLLYAADLAKQKGKAGFVIVARRDFKRTMNVTRGFSHTPVSSSPAGFKTELDIRFVDSILPAGTGASITPAGTIDRDRIIDAAQAYTDLAPVYIRQEAS